LFFKDTGHCPVSDFKRICPPIYSQLWVARYNRQMLLDSCEEGSSSGVGVPTNTLCKFGGSEVLTIQLSLRSARNATSGESNYWQSSAELYLHRNNEVQAYTSDLAAANSSAESRDNIHAILPI
jgi:hypothetical protein